MCAASMKVNIVNMHVYSYAYPYPCNLQYGWEMQHYSIILRSHVQKEAECLKLIFHGKAAGHFRSESSYLLYITDLTIHSLIAC